MSRTQPPPTRHPSEGFVEAFLCHQGLQPVARNHRCRRGELDLVMLDARHSPSTLAFIEVRARKAGHDHALASIDARKQQRLMAAAEDFLNRHPCWQQHPCRFDVVTLNQPAAAPHWRIAAFEVQA